MTDAHDDARDRPAPGLSVTVLGSAGTYAHPGNACSGYLVRANGTAVWVDAGPGTLAAVQEHVALADLDAVVITHEHPDHWLELPVIRNAARYVLGIEHLPVYGTAGTRDLAAAVIGADADPVAWTTITDGSVIEVGGLELRFARTDHPVETLAPVIRDERGRRIVYSADTGSGWSFDALDPGGDGFDLALCEATLPPEHRDAAQHLTGAQAGEMAARAGVRRLVVTHLYEGTAERRVEEASEAGDFDAPVEAALPGRTFTV